MIQHQNQSDNTKRRVTKTWLTGQKSCTLIIPRDTARKYDLEEPSHVVVEETPEGILIRKLNLQRGEYY
jgi:hypothetical protein